MMTIASPENTVPENFEALEVRILTLERKLELVEESLETLTLQVAIDMTDMEKLTP